MPLRPPEHRPSLVIWWVLLVLSLGSLALVITGCRMIWVRAAGDVSVNTEDTESRVQTAGTNGVNRNVEAAIEVTP